VSVVEPAALARRRGDEEDAAVALIAAAVDAVAAVRVAACAVQDAGQSETDRSDDGDLGIGDRRAAAGFDDASLQTGCCDDTAAAMSRRAVTDKC